MAEACTLWVWRHPKPQGAAGRCIGRTDLPVDPRRARRLAHRILSIARREQLPREVWTSPLARGREVGRWLARQGFPHVSPGRTYCRRGPRRDSSHWGGGFWSGGGGGFGGFGGGGGGGGFSGGGGSFVGGGASSSW